MATKQKSKRRRPRKLLVTVFQGRGARRQFYWRAKARNGQTVAVGGEGYTRRSDARRAFLRVVLALALCDYEWT